MVEQKQVGGNRSRSSGDFFQLSFSDESCRIRTIAALQNFAGDFGSRAERQVAQFVERFFSAELRIGVHTRRSRRRIPRRLRPAGQVLAALAAAVVEAHQERALLAHSGRKDRTSGRAGLLPPAPCHATIWIQYRANSNSLIPRYRTRSAASPVSFSVSVAVPTQRPSAAAPNTHVPLGHCHR